MSTDNKDPKINEIWYSPVTGTRLKILVKHDQEYTVEYLDGIHSGELTKVYKSGLDYQVSEPTDEYIPQPGDIYDSNIGYKHYVLITTPDKQGFCAAERHSFDGSVGYVIINPNNSFYIKRIERPSFPVRSDNRVILTEYGGISSKEHPSTVAYVDYRDIPWRWTDGQLITDEEKGLQND